MLWWELAQSQFYDHECLRESPKDETTEWFRWNWLCSGFLCRGLKGSIHIAPPAEWSWCWQSRGKHNRESLRSRWSKCSWISRIQFVRELRRVTLAIHSGLDLQLNPFEAVWKAQWASEKKETSASSKRFFCDSFTNKSSMYTLLEKDFIVSSSNRLKKLTGSLVNQW